MLAWNPDSASDSSRAEKTYRDLTHNGFRIYRLDITDYECLRCITKFDANIGRVVAIRLVDTSKGSLDSKSG
jgi:hypothetical protein